MDKIFHEKHKKKAGKLPAIFISAAATPQNAGNNDGKVWRAAFEYAAATPQNADNNDGQAL